MSPLLDRNDSQLFCFVLPGTDFIARMLPLLNIMFGSSGHSLSTVNCAPDLSLLLLCSVFLQKSSLRFCLFPSIFHVARYLFRHFPPSSRTRRRLRSWEKNSVLAAHTYMHACMHADIHTYIHTYTHRHTYIHTYIHTQTYIHTYIHRYIPSFHTPPFLLTYHLPHTFRSFTTFFVFPSFPVGMITSHKARRKSLQNLRLHSAEHYIQTYMHTYIASFHTPSFFVTHDLSHTTLSHATLLTSRSFSTSFVFPSFPVPPLQRLLLMVHTHTPHTQLITTQLPHTQLTHTRVPCCTRQSFTISFLFPAFPMPSLPLFCCVLEEVDMWGYPVLYVFPAFLLFLILWRNPKEHHIIHKP